MNTTEDRTARAALTHLFEPGDIVGRALVAKHGAHAALRIDIGARPAYPFWDVTAEELAEGLSRWAPRIHDLDPEKALPPSNAWAGDSSPLRMSTGPKA